RRPTTSDTGSRARSSSRNCGGESIEIWNNNAKNPRRKPASCGRPLVLLFPTGGGRTQHRPRAPMEREKEKKNSTTLGPPPRRRGATPRSRKRKKSVLHCRSMDAPSTREQRLHDRACFAEIHFAGVALLERRHHLAHVLHAGGADLLHHTGDRGLRFGLRHLL